MENESQTIDLFEEPEFVSVKEFDIENYTYNIQEIDFDVSIPSGQYTISLGPMASYEPPKQQEMFRHYIMSHWLHSSHLADEDPQWQCESIIKDHEHLTEAQADGKLEISLLNEDTVEYWYKSSQEDFFMWKLRWSEFFDQNNYQGIIDD